MIIRQYLRSFILLVPIWVSAQLCEPDYQIPLLMHVNSVNGQMETSDFSAPVGSMTMTIGLPLIVNSATDNSTYSSAQGFWSYYLTEPLPPVLTSSDGDYIDMVLLDWEIENDLTGPPVTGENAVIYRNGFALETVPISQSQYLDFNVFAGTNYSYRVEVTNELGSSQEGLDVGYLDPNGVITGQILTASGNAVAGGKVTLEPNLGRSAKFEGDGYIYWYDIDSTSNLQFSGFESDYTIETWFRSVNEGTEQTIFAAVDSGTSDHYILLELTSDNKVAWTHSEDGTVSQQVKVTSPESVVASGAPFYHLALVFKTGTMTMYIDGSRVAVNDAGVGYIGSKVEMVIGKLGPTQHEKYLHGYLDDFRVWRHAVDWSDLIDNKKMTLSGNEDNLAGYWKFDERDGEIVVDISVDNSGNDNNNDAATCNVERSELIAPVYVGAITDVNGNYSIRNVYYGDGTTFTATPSQEGIVGRSLEFDGIDMYVDFQNNRLDLTNQFTIEGFFRTELESDMTIFHAVNPLDESTQIRLDINSSGNLNFYYLDNYITSGDLDLADNQWHHWAMTCDISTDTVYAYIDDVLQGHLIIGSDILSNLSIPYFASSNGESQWFDGLLDEIRVWNEARTQTQISGLMGQTLTGDELGLRHYWNFNEGDSTILNDNGGGLVIGEIKNMDNDDAWTRDIPLEEVFEHYYDPESRQVTLNYSNTSVDLVNFTDNSLIPVSGYVRFSNTSCIIEGAEILLNSASLIPPVYTDSDGKFTVDIEPGSSGNLISASYNDHQFTPAFIELPILTAPLSGQYFDDLTTRTASGTVAGGTCGIPLGDNITVSLSSVDGCIEEVVDVDSTGNWVSSELPPTIYNVSVYHPSPEIDQAFGADTMSLKESDRIRNFTYRSELKIEFVEGSTMTAQGYADDGLDPFCTIESVDGIQNADAILKQGFQYQVDFKVFEIYNGLTCDVDTFDISFTNHISGGAEGAMDSSSIVLDDDEENPSYYFNALHINKLSSENGSNDYQLSISTTVTDKRGAQASDTYWAFIIGDEAIPNESFTVTSSSEPWYVLRVPPGDASYTEFSTEQEICRSNVIRSVASDGLESELTLHLGFESESCVGIGIAYCQNNTVDADIGSGFSLSTTVTDIDEVEECLTVSNTYTASGMGLITGDDATVFIGGGKTMSLGVSYYLHINDECSITIDTVLAVGNSEVSSVYMFEKYYIENFLIPNLYAEAQQGIEGAQDGYDYFTALMETDSIAVENAIDETVYSFGGDSSLTSIAFSAGASYDYNFETGKSFSNTHTITMDSELEVSAGGGFMFSGFGMSSASSVSTSTESEEENSVSESAGQTVGFHLEDDDIGDAFAFSMKRDPVWGMPVFKFGDGSAAGQSSCPWEEGTLTRQSCGISVSGPSEAFDIAPDEAANFILRLENTSQTSEDQTYELSVLGETNLNGAEVTSSGVNLNENELIYVIEAGSYLEVEVSIERGPTEYSYSGITVQLAPQCEDEIADAIGSGADPQNAGYVELAVNFIEPCSFSTITSPSDDWLVTGSHEGDTLNITVTGYDLDTASFNTLSLEYRASGYGDFFPIETIDRDSLISLGTDYAIIAWNISPEIVADGSYEIRSVVGCSGDDHDGVSNVVQGIIDRTGPEVFGLPSPSDGILNLGDVISIEFDEPIDCEAIIISNPDIALQNTLTSQWLDLNYTCGDNMITMVYPDGNQYIENQTLRAYINNLYDILGNAISDTITWEFFVNNNPVGWVGTDIAEVVIYIDDEYSTSRILTNYGGSNNSWYLFGGRDVSEGALSYPYNTLDIPDWLNVAPLSGTLEPGSSQDITINLEEGIGYGTYSTTLYAGVTGDGDEPLNIDIRKLCYEPDWSINPSNFEYSMTMTAILRKHLSQVVIDTSTDTYDLVGVFVGEELRGVGTVEYLPELESLSGFHPYEVFLTIYSNQSSGEELSFKVWNASGCALLGQIEEDFVFIANSSEGTLTNPATLTATSHIVQENALSTGWTWISQNTVDEDMSTNYLLSSLSPSSNDIIKGHGNYSQFSELSGTWVGNLDSMSHQQSYLIKISDHDTMATIGYAVDVELDTIDIVEGWNWIGYTPQESFSINHALESLDSVETGDMLKNQYGFAEYLENYGWFGSIDFMNPHLGYMLKTSNNDKLLYPFTIPDSPNQGTFNPHSVEQSLDAIGVRSPRQNQSRKDNEPVIISRGENAPDWTVDPHQYSGSMTVTGMISTFGDLQGASQDMVGAFINDTCRGMGQLKYVEPLDQYLVFMTIYGEVQDFDRTITFQVYNNETDELLYVPEILPFFIDNVSGSIVEPFIWNARYLMIGDSDYIPDVYSLAQNYPNPFNPITNIGYGIPERSDVKILVYNLVGELVATIVDESKEPGYYFTKWNSKNDMGYQVSSGMYIYQIKANNFIKTRKLLLVK